MTDIETGTKIVKAGDAQGAETTITTNNATAPPALTDDNYSLKFTASDVKHDRCPKLLQNLQKQIAAHLR